MHTDYMRKHNIFKINRSNVQVRIADQQKTRSKMKSHCMSPVARADIDIVTAKHLISYNLNEGQKSSMVNL